MRMKSLELIAHLLLARVLRGASAPIDAPFTFEQIFPLLLTLLEENKQENSKAQATFALENCIGSRRAFQLHLNSFESLLTKLCAILNIAHKETTKSLVASALSRIVSIEVSFDISPMLARFYQPLVNLLTPGFAETTRRIAADALTNCLLKNQSISNNPEIFEQAYKLLGNLLKPEFTEATHVAAANALEHCFAKTKVRPDAATLAQVYPQWSRLLQMTRNKKMLQSIMNSLRYCLDGNPITPEPPVLIAICNSLIKITTNSIDTREFALLSLVACFSVKTLHSEQVTLAELYEPLLKSLETAQGDFANRLIYLLAIILEHGSPPKQAFRPKIYQIICGVLECGSVRLSNIMPCLCFWLKHSVNDANFISSLHQVCEKLVSLFKSAERSENEQMLALTFVASILKLPEFNAPIAKRELQPLAKILSKNVKTPELIMFAKEALRKCSP